ncbi:MAG: hypothetical protein ACRDA8_00895, partial [Shewanella sp.]
QWFGSDQAKNLGVIHKNRFYKKPQITQNWRLKGEHIRGMHRVRLEPRIPTPLIFELLVPKSLSSLLTCRSERKMAAFYIFSSFIMEMWWGIFLPFQP